MPPADVIEPFTAGHTLVVPRRHATGLSDVDDACAGRMFEVGRARATLRCPGVNLFLADGAAAWQTVFHLHVIPPLGPPGQHALSRQARSPTPRRAGPELDRLAAGLRP